MLQQNVKKASSKRQTTMTNIETLKKLGKKEYTRWTIS